MKVVFNQTLQNTNNSRYFTTKQLSPKREIVVESPATEEQSVNSTSLASFANVSFKSNHDMKFLLNQTKKLRCAYSGRIMIPPSEAKEIYQKLAKRPNAQSAINLLQNYEGYMHDIESIIFDIFKEASHKGKRTFQDILQEEAPEAKIRLKEKQIKTLNKANKIIDSMSAPIAEQVRKIRDESLLEVEQDIFGRKAPLEKIKKIKAKGADLSKIIQVYQTWYKSPASGKDLDAFIVKYSKRSHDNIAKRLISSAVASIEHIKPSSRGGADGLGNFLLVSAQFNNTRNSMPLAEYIALNSEIDIPRHLQNYIDDVVHQTNNKKSPFNQKPGYVIRIIERLSDETNGTVKLTHPPIHLPQETLRENELTAQKLRKKYTVIDK